MSPKSRSAQSTSRLLVMFYLLAAVVTSMASCGKPPEQLREGLLVAARNGDTETVKSLLKQGVDINARRNPQGWTALHYAASGAHLQIVELLLQSKADPHAVGSAGNGLSSKPRVVAQAGRAMVDYLKGGKIQFEPSPEGGLQATDDDAGRRYEAIISLLAAAEATHGATK